MTLDLSRLMSRLSSPFRALALIAGLASALLATPAARADALTCQVLPDLFRFYLVAHYSAKELTDEIKSHTVEQYIKSLDPSKTLLLEEDVTRLRRELTSLFSSMRYGNCKALSEAQDLLIKRVTETEASVRNILGDNYKLDESVEIMTDTDKRGYAKSLGDREALLKKFIHLQIANQQLSDMKLPEAKKQLIHRYELATKRAKERKADDEIVSFADAFAAALDPHSNFLSEDRLEDFRIDMSLSLEGIGAQLSSQDGYTTVEEIVPGGAADRAKVLQPKDKIISVAQDGKDPVSVIDMDLRDVVKLIRGKKGTKVTLTLLRQGESSERVVVSITRDKIQMKDAEAKLRVETRKVGDRTLKLGVIDLPGFYGEGEKGKRSSYADIKRLLEEANKKKVEGVVLNLSMNGGGLLDDAVKMSGLFIKQGGIVATKSSGTRKPEVLADEDSNIVFKGPLVVLTSRISASASEILAGALKDYHRAVIVGGDHTYGKGTVQAVQPLPRDLGAIKITTGMFFLPGGASTQHQGVSGDVVLPSPFSTDEVGEKSQDYSLPPQRIDAFLSKDANNNVPTDRFEPITTSMIEQLAAKSSARVAKDAKFEEIKKEMEEAKKNKGVLKLAEFLKKSQTAKKKDKKDEKKSFAQRTQDAQAPYVNEALNVLGDLVVLQSSSAPAATITKGTKKTASTGGTR